MTSQPPELPGPDQLRASHADRERVAAVLTDAMAQGRLTPAELEERLDIVYGAKTLGELVPVTRDLPVAGNLPGPAVPMPAAAPLPAVARVGGHPTSKFAFALMSGSDRKGEWVVPRQFTAVAIMGGVDLDLTEAFFETNEVTITAVALMGGVDIIVPDDVEVRANGLGVMGGFDHRVPPPPAGGRHRVLTVNGAALMGGVDIRRLSDRELRKRARQRGELE